VAERIGVTGFSGTAVELHQEPWHIPDHFIIRAWSPNAYRKSCSEYQDVRTIRHLFGTSVPFIHESRIIGILFSLGVVVIATLNLVLDFDFIEQGAESGAPKFLEWYAAFGLLVTLVWLYIEILHLLMKLQNRD